MNAAIGDSEADAFKEGWEDGHEEGYDRGYEDGVNAAEDEIARLRALNDELVAALDQLASVIDAAGLSNLMNGVQLGPTVWFVKASDAMQYARAVLARAGEQK